MIKYDIFNLDFCVKGKGDSLWCNSDVTKNVNFLINSVKVRLFPDASYRPYELILRGPDTKWYHYVDSGIENDVCKIMLPILRERYPDFKIRTITWSEHGMQPADGWSFDICLVK